ncbi:MAG: DUF805 domain-containing protein [Bacteroidales bacterium]|nr:DUF805 domain-containing protein [Bacteroidales bacterium]MDD6141190.1 DUF805 domain-containing protein [Bacteroidales bacterium]
MGKLKCVECGQIFNENQNECPNCGCPASECEKIAEMESVSSKLIECPSCGMKISIDAKRCPHCGSKGKFAPLDYGNAIYDCFCRKYYCFTGRSRRSEVFPFIILTGMMCGTLLYLKPDNSNSGGPSPELIPFIITILPTLGAIVRRLHDIGRSGWWVLLPIFGEIFIFKDSDKKENEYGKSPKYQPEYFTEELPDKGTHIVKAIIFAAIFALLILLLLGCSIGS